MTGFLWPLPLTPAFSGASETVASLLSTECREARIPRAKWLPPLLHICPGRGRGTEMLTFIWGLGPRTQCKIWSPANAVQAGMGSMWQALPSPWVPLHHHLGLCLSPILWAVLFHQTLKTLVLDTSAPLSPAHLADEHSCVCSWVPVSLLPGFYCRPVTLGCCVLFT